MDFSDEFLNPPGQISPGNIDIYNRPQTKLSDGSIATVRSMGIGGPNNIKGIIDEVQSPAFSTVIGLTLSTKGGDGKQSKGISIHLDHIYGIMNSMVKRGMVIKDSSGAGSSVAKKLF